MTKANKAAKSVFILAVFALTSKILGFFREILIASKFGAGIESDAFFIAQTATGLISTIFIGSIKTTMIPILSAIEAKEGKKAKILHTNNFLNIFLLITIFFILIIFVVTPYFIKILAVGFEGYQLELAVMLTRLGLPIIFLSCLLYVFRGYLQSEMRFAEEGVSALPSNFVLIFYLLLLSNVFGIKGLMVAKVIAVLSQIIIQIPNLKKLSFRYNVYINLADPYLKKFMSLIPPVLISVGISDLNRIIDRSMASTLLEGSISALNYGSRLTSLIQGIFIMTLSTVIFPMLSNEVNRDNIANFKKMLRYGFNTIVLITIPATVGMIVLAEPIVRIAFQRGVFGAEATYLTTGALIFYSIGLVAVSLKFLLNKAYYSMQDTKTPMINSMIAVSINIILNLMLIRYMAHRGLALATSISAIASCGLLIYLLRKKIGALGIKSYITCGIKALISSVIMGAAAYFMYYFLNNIMGHSKIGDLLALLISAGTGALLYFAFIYIMKVEEFQWLVGLIKKKVFKNMENNKLD
ncbi:MAG: murein biosynthesis integral membrane protein MurJ [Clostridiales bacterium]|nr:murein biosynthesis integral membrane protein MurJ [Clostridiales bacterium]